MWWALKFVPLVSGGCVGWWVVAERPRPSPTHRANPSLPEPDRPSPPERPTERARPSDRPSRPTELGGADRARPSQTEPDRGMDLSVNDARLFMKSAEGNPMASYGSLWNPMESCHNFTPPERATSDEISPPLRKGEIRGPIRPRHSAYFKISNNSVSPPIGGGNGDGSLRLPCCE